MESKTVTRDNLNEIMDFDHVIRVHPDGTVTYPADVYAPELDDDDTVLGGEWELLDGYSGQQGYSGPIMHPSEYIGGGMADDILSRPGLYVALVSSDGDTDHGWAVAYREA
jgi:hypothetical protein